MSKADCKCKYRSAITQEVITLYRTFFGGLISRHGFLIPDKGTVKASAKAEAFFM